ncbi:MAG: hypothetical protein K1X79_06030 [Oligoflexia bacterium]|nr:hypothetical protein [Oligoflexia bacterium]
MVDNSKINNLLFRGTDISAGTTQATPTQQTNNQIKNAEISKNEFLNLLVTQLKNQDPLDPMKNDQFAVNLAQFSQLEQLVSINDKIGTQKADLNSMAAYLGHMVTLNSDTTSVSNHNGGTVKFDLARDAADVRIELVKDDGSVADSFSLGAMSQGSQTIDLANIGANDGEYHVRVQAQSTIGTAFQPTVHAAGMVSGFIPGPDPKLLVGGKQVDPSSVLEVSVPS